MLLVSGVVADVDWVSYAGGARAFLSWHRAATDSLLGTAVIAVVTAAFFVYFGRRNSSRPVRLLPALSICAAGAGLHLLLDLTNSYGVMLLWPFSPRWFAWDLAGRIDPWVLLLLLAGLLLPALFGLISEEVGARPRGHRGQRGAIVALAAVGLYFGGRALAHERALALLNARVYAGATPLRVAAFPDPSSPLDWRGIVDTDDAVDEIAVPVLSAEPIDPDTARRHFKPAESEVLERARRSPSAQAFLAFARFPLAAVERTPEGYEVRIRDLRFAAMSSGWEVIAVVELNEQEQVTADLLQFYDAR
jgi:inner membrane protein